MGMDVYGLAPKSEVGKYFRRNVWGWRPLWDYVEDMHPEIAGKVEYAQTNDGDGLTDKWSIALADLLDRDVEWGKALEYIIERDAKLLALPKVPCELCNATGIRTDRVGIEAGMHTRALDPEVAEQVGRTHGFCNACAGLGENADFATHYYLELDDIKEFSAFLRESGGFEIC